jgi:hypothetical protein
MWQCQCMYVQLHCNVLHGGGLQRFMAPWPLASITWLEQLFTSSKPSHGLDIAGFQQINGRLRYKIMSE